MSDHDASDGESLEEGAQKANSNLQHLIEAVGGLLAASADLLGHLQQILSTQAPDEGTEGSDEPRVPPPTDRGDV